jgi:hypothetical protein
MYALIYSSVSVSLYNYFILVLYDRIGVSLKLKKLSGVSEYASESSLSSS